MTRNALIPVLCLIAVMAAGAELGTCNAGYLAWAHTTKNGKQPLPQDLTTLAKQRPTDLVVLEWSEFQGKRRTIRVLETQNNSDVASYGAKATVTGPDGQKWSYEYQASGADYNTVPVNGLDAMVTNILTQTNRFRVLERESLDKIFEEQDLGESGRMLKPSAPKVGKALGAKYGIKLVVHSYQPNVKGKKGGLGGAKRFMRKLGGVGAAAAAVTWENVESSVSITLQLIDLESTEILGSAPVEVRLKKRKIGGGGIGFAANAAFGAFMSGYGETPIGQAMIAAVNVGTFQLMQEYATGPTEGQVQLVNDQGIMLNLGSGQVKVGDIVTLFSAGEPIYDTETGELLDAGESRLGRAEVTSTKDKISYAAPIDGFDKSQVKRGDLVRASVSVTYEYGAGW